MRQELAVKDSEPLSPDKDVEGEVDNKVLDEKKLVITPNRGEVLRDGIHEQRVIVIPVKIKIGSSDILV